MRLSRGGSERMLEREGRLGFPYYILYEVIRMLRLVGPAFYKDGSNANLFTTVGIANRWQK